MSRPPCHIMRGRSGSGQMRKGRELETIVAALERCFAPDEATITSPDHIADRMTGQQREVDVSIRYVIGSAPILVILECRDRSVAQDVTWIEQLAQKRSDVRASRAVAVSSSGFSEAARVKAAHQAIELRTIDELTRESVLPWCAVTHTESRVLRSDLLNGGIRESSG